MKSIQLLICLSVALSSLLLAVSAAPDPNYALQYFHDGPTTVSPCGGGDLVCLINCFLYGLFHNPLLGCCSTEYGGYAIDKFHYSPDTQCICCENAQKCQGTCAPITITVTPEQQYLAYHG